MPVLWLSFMGMGVVVLLAGIVYGVKAGTRRMGGVSISRAICPQDSEARPRRYTAIAVLPTVRTSPDVHRNLSILASRKKADHLPATSRT